MRIAAACQNQTVENFPYSRQSITLLIAVNRFARNLASKNIIDNNVPKRIVTSSPICLPACGAIHKFQLKRSKARFRIQAETGFSIFTADISLLCKTECSTAPTGENGTGGFDPDCGPRHLGNAAK
jgi:hypothetical protein